MSRPLMIQVYAFMVNDSALKCNAHSPNNVLHAPGRGLYLLLRLGDAANGVLDNPEVRN